tara:strand:+ start:1825 stop:2838 length:1014 start_codon:yes stop_codon:yes gene_type:complete
MRAEKRDDGSTALYGEGNKFMGNQPPPVTPEQRGQQDRAYADAYAGQPSEPQSAPPAAPQAPAPPAFMQSMDRLNQGDLSGFTGVRTPNSARGQVQPADFMAAQNAGMDAPSIERGSALPDGFSGYQTRDGKYRVIGPDGKPQTFDNEAAAIQSLSRAPAPAGAPPAAPQSTPGYAPNAPALTAPVGSAASRSIMPGAQPAADPASVFNRPVGSAAGRAMPMPTTPAAPTGTAAQTTSPTAAIAQNSKQVNRRPEGFTAGPNYAQQFAGTFATGGGGAGRLPGGRRPEPPISSTLNVSQPRITPAPFAQGEDPLRVGTPVQVFAQAPTGRRPRPLLE